MSTAVAEKCSYIDLNDPSLIIAKVIDGRVVMPATWRDDDDEEEEG